MMLGALAALAWASAAPAADRPQWGEAWSRNMVSAETGLPDGFDPAAGTNVRWSVPLGANTYATPVVARGKVLIGTDNDRPRDPRHQGDRGVLMCLDEADGRLLWQLVIPKLKGDPYRDWPHIGICSPPTVEGDRAYVVTNRGAVVCLDLEGQADGNDGPFADEGRLMADDGQPPMAVTGLDADVLWRFDTHAEAGTYPHDSPHASILIDGEYLYLNTSTGVDNTHRVIRRPDGPSLIVLEKATGRLVARDAERIGPRIFHCTWSSPGLGEAGGRRLILFGGGDGVCYAFEPLAGAPPPPGTVLDLKRVWRFDCDPEAPKEDVHRFTRNRQEGPSNIKSTLVLHGGRVYVTVGGDIWWGKHQAWLKCIDASQTGDVTKTAQAWSYTLKQHCCSTPSVAGGLVYAADCGATLHCVDAATGQAVWTHDLGGDVWGSTLVADGKVYVGTRRRGFWVLAAGREKRVLASVALDSPMASVPVAANGRLYVATLKTLYALEKR